MSSEGDTVPSSQSEPPCSYSTLQLWVSWRIDSMASSQLSETETDELSAFLRLSSQPDHDLRGSPSSIREGSVSKVLRVRFHSSAPCVHLSFHRASDSVWLLAVQSCGTYWIWRWVPSQISWMSEFKGNLISHSAEPDITDVIDDIQDGVNRGLLSSQPRLPQTSKPTRYPDGQLLYID